MDCYLFNRLLPFQWVVTPSVALISAFYPFSGLICKICSFSGSEFFPFNGLISEVCPLLTWLVSFGPFSGLIVGSHSHQWFDFWVVSPSMVWLLSCISSIGLIIGLYPVNGMIIGFYPVSGMINRLLPLQWSDSGAFTHSVVWSYPHQWLNCWVVSPSMV